MTVQSPIKNPDQFFIGGRWVNPASSARFNVLNAATEETFGWVAEAVEADVNRAVSAARVAFDQGTWPRLQPEERARYLRALAHEMDQLVERGALIWSCESGILNSTALQIYQTISSFYRYYADLAQHFEFEQPHPSSAEGWSALLVHEPVGVAGIIIPWNGPANLSAIKLAPALLAGCTVVLKMSPEAPGVGYLIAEACENIGLPPGVVNVITADRKVSELLVRHPDVDKICFTGSTAAGRRIGSICGERMARFTLELGGKSAAILCDDFDVEEAASIIGPRATFLTGQVCSSLTRLIVPRHKHDLFVEALKDYFSKVKVGDPLSPESGMGPLATATHRARVEHYISKGKEEGAVLATGGKRPNHLDRGFFIEPTIFCNVDNRYTISQEEIFGPVVSVIPVNNETEAIEVANDSVYGLGGAVFTHDDDKAYRIGRGIRTGTVIQNAHRVEMLVGYGGFKQSGIGRMGGVEGLRAYLEPKTLSLRSIPALARADRG